MRHVLTELRTSSRPKATVTGIAIIVLFALAATILLITRWRQSSSHELDLRPFAVHNDNLQGRSTTSATPPMPVVRSAGTEAEMELELDNEVDTLSELDVALTDQPLAQVQGVPEDEPEEVVTSNVATLRASPPSAGQIARFSTLAADLQPVAGQPLVKETFDAGHDWALWESLGGNWSVTDGMMVQEMAEGFDNAIIHKLPVETYVLRVPIRHIAGTGAGVLFNLPSLTDTAGGQLVRFTDDGTGLFWGFYDPVSGFSGQGYAATGSPGADWRLIEVLSGRESYSIWLDGQLIAKDIPLVSRQGAVGLTTSNSSAAFYSLEVLRTEQSLTAEAQDVSAFTTIAGQWTIEEYEIRQTDTAAADLSVGTGIEAAQYVLEVSIRMPVESELQDSGAGLLFHMPFRDRIDGAQMVRFVEGGRGLAWGVFDAEGNFNGQGFLPLELAPGEVQRLTLTVDGSSFAVAVNGQIAVENGTALRSRGWIGLTTYRGPVIFRDISFALGKERPERVVSEQRQWTD